LFSIGCGIGIGKSSYKYKIFVDTGGIRNHILYSDSFDIDTHGFLIVTSPKVRGESHVGRVICSPGTYFILER
jgi:hypothetical protein